jgi:hypothetical protein
MNPLFKRKLLISLLVFFVTGSLQADVLRSAVDSQPEKSLIKDNHLLLKHSLSFNQKFKIKNSSCHFYSLKFAGLKFDNPNGLFIAFSPYFFDKHSQKNNEPLKSFGMSFRVSLSF